MSKKEQLFNLIHALTKAEKRHFKLFSATLEKKDKSHIQLFDAIDKQKKYDEKALKKKFANASFIKHFAVVKNYLFNSIMKSLRLYHSDKTPMDKIMNMQKNVYILKRKNLTDLAMTQLDKALKHSVEGGFLREQVLLTHWRDNFTANRFYTEKTPEEIDEELSEKTKICEQLLNYYQYVELSGRIDYLIMRKGIRSQDRAAKLKELFDNPLLQNTQPLSWRASIFYHHARSSYFLAQKNYEDYLIEVEQNLQLFENNAFLMHSEPLTYLGIYYNFINACSCQKSYEYLDKHAQKYQIILNESADQKDIKFNVAHRQFYTQHLVYIEFFIRRKQFNKAVEKVEESLNEFEANQHKWSDFFTLNYYYQVAYAYFGHQQYEKAQEYLMKLLNESSLQQREIIHTSTQVLHLLVHYELGNYEYLDAQTKNIRLYFSRKDLYYNFEKSAIQLIIDLMRAKESQEPILNKHKAILEELKKDLIQQDALEHLDLIYWIEQKLAVLRVNGL